jgi:hypothetical protein
MSDTYSRRSLVQFSIQGLFLVLLICAVLLGWWRDRQRLAEELRRAQAMLDALQGASRSHQSKAGSGVPYVRPEPPNKCATPEEFIKALREIKNWYEFADETADPFVKTPVADKTIPMLIELLRDPKPEIRWRALSTLGKIARHAETIVPAVIPLLKDDHDNVRWHAACALSHFGRDAQAAVPALWEQINDDSSPIAAWAADMLRKIDPNADVEPRLIALLNRGDQKNRERALSALSDIGSARVKTALLDAFRRETDGEFRAKIGGVIAWLDAKETRK